MGDQNLRQRVIELLSEELGILAEVVVDEVMEELGAEDKDLTRHLAGRFVRVLDKRLSIEKSNKQALVREVGKLLIKGG
jgi:Mor family transcriptional regulator